MARVCMVVFNDYTRDARVQREAEALVERGDTVDCICLSRERITHLRGVRLFYLPGGKYRGTNSLWLLILYLRFFCYAFFILSILHLRAPYDVVQAHTMPDFLIFTALVPKLLGAKLVLDMHDLMPEIYVAKYGPNASKWMVGFIKLIERRSVAFADKAIAVHDPHLEALVDHGNPRDKFSILMNVPDHRIFRRMVRPPAHGHVFRLIYHGTIPKRAGLDVALQAVARARKQIPNIHFQIIGKGEELGALVRLMKDLSLEDCVEITPMLPVEQLPGVISRAHLAVIPYTADAFTQYVLPTKLMEYAAIGIPAIVSRLRTIEAYFNSRMVSYFEPGNHIELADHIVKLYRDPAIAQQLACAAALFGETYNWLQQREIYYEMMDSLLPVRPFLIDAN